MAILSTRDDERRLLVPLGAYFVVAGGMRGGVGEQGDPEAHRVSARTERARGLRRQLHRQRHPARFGRRELDVGPVASVAPASPSTSMWKRCGCSVAFMSWTR